MMTRQRTNISLASITVIVVAILIIAHPWVQVSVKQYHIGDTVTYTDAVTGSSNTDIPGESGNQLADIVPPASATINGLDSLRNYLSDPQYLSVASELSDFLFAHSGASVVTAGIRNTAIAQSNNKLTFTLIADRPQATYSVTIDTSDTLKPSITMEPLE